VLAKFLGAGGFDVVSGILLTDTPVAFTTSYRQALKEYLLGENEEALMHAYDLGRRAVNEHCNILDLMATHQKVILQSVPDCENKRRMDTFIKRGEAFLTEVMAPIEMMRRSFTDTISQLQDINATLELRVEKRTRALQDAQRKSADLARLYLILSSINNAIVRLHDRAELFREACRIAVEQGGYPLAWIGMEGKDGPAAANTWCRLADDGSASQIVPIEAISMEVGEDLDRLYREGKPVVGHHRQQSAASQAADDPIDYHSYALLPLLLNDKVVGAFALFSTRAEDFAGSEIRLLVELAGDLSFALDHIQKEKQLKYLIYYDTLTGLPNRDLLLEHLPLQFRAAMRVDNMVALLLIELVHFSDINDTYGRYVGDNLLRQVGERLRNATGKRETVAKVGGYRFAVSLTGLVRTDEVAHRLEQEILHSFVEPFKINGLEIHIAAQVGIALFPSDGTDPDTLYKYAEMALKRTQIGGEPYLLYNSTMNERIVHSVTMEAKLRKAIEKGRLVLNYQPKISTADGRIASMEGLVRYADPEEGIVLPGRFIPIMEGTGMIIEIGNWVIRHAVDDIIRWRRLELNPPRVAVNVSAFQLRQKNFVDSLLRMLPAGADDHGLDIEITESALVHDVEEIIPKLQAVRDLGFGIAIDDFGTGYSSLSYLIELPVTTLKIDRSFIIDMTERPKSLALVSTIISLAHSLDLEVVAEGVDQEEQAKLLRLLRCDLIQGNLYSPPLSNEQMTLLLGRPDR
jgi:diguanylate cyclase (GGDEF)-like protein